MDDFREIMARKATEQESRRRYELEKAAQAEAANNHEREQIARIERISSRLATALTRRNNPPPYDRELIRQRLELRPLRSRRKEVLERLAIGWTADIREVYYSSEAGSTAYAGIVLADGGAVFQFHHTVPRLGNGLPRKIVFNLDISDSGWAGRYTPGQRTQRTGMWASSAAMYTPEQVLDGLAGLALRHNVDPSIFG